MKLEEKLQLLRKRSGYSQEQLADKIDIARQTISKWETGQAIPELHGLIRLSELYGVSIDRIVKEDEECNIQFCKHTELDLHEGISFLVRAKKNTYPAGTNKAPSSRKRTIHYCYEEEPFQYFDTYLGKAQFSGEETLWLYDTPVWRMNYSGRILREPFHSSFLKEVLAQVSEDRPYRGPQIFTKGDYHYHNHIDGDFAWFHGYEEIFYIDVKIYEGYFHGGIIQ